MRGACLVPSHSDLGSRNGLVIGDLRLYCDRQPKAPLPFCGVSPILTRGNRGGGKRAQARELHRKRAIGHTTSQLAGGAYAGGQQDLRRAMQGTAGGCTQVLWCADSTKQRMRSLAMPSINGSACTKKTSEWPMMYRRNASRVRLSLDGASPGILHYGTKTGST